MSIVTITADADQALRLYEAGVISLKELRIWLGFRDEEPEKDHGFKVGDTVRGDDYRNLPVGTVVGRGANQLTRTLEGYEAPHGTRYREHEVWDKREIVKLP